jgi:hypothetical protein|tara:strand:+ start:2450 stop:4630 length:2181 start_codon:yes stop_codon:yes gene_type:complete
MAETLVSPGVLQRENDRSFVAPSPVEVGAALIGPTVKGPVEIPTVVTSFGDYRETFGSSFLSGSNQFEFLTSISAQKYFAEGGNSLLVTRVAPGAFTKATSTRILANTGSITGTNPTSSISAFTLSQTGSATGIRIIDNTLGKVDTIIFSASAATDQENLGLFAYTGANLKGLRDKINNDTGLNTRFSSSINATFDVLAISGANASTTLNGFVIETGSLQQLTLAASGTLKNLGTIGGGIVTTTATNTDSNISFTLKTIGQGIKFNNALDSNPDNISLFSDGALKTGSEDNVRWQISNINNSQGTFTLIIRRGDDTTRSKLQLETFTNVTLDPKSDSYIERVIGNQFLSVDTNTDPKQPLIKLNGDHPNRSRYVYVHSVQKQTPDYFNKDGSVNIATNGNSYSSSLPLPTSGAFAGATGDIITSEAGKYFENIGPDATANIQGLSEADYDTAIKLLKNTDDFRFNLITAPGVNYKDHSSTFNKFVELVEDRGDSFFIGDLVGHGETLSTVTLQTDNLNTSFAGSYWPWVKVRSSELSRDVFTPASTVMPGVYAFNDRVAAPWFAPAGLNRGGLNVSRAEVKLTSGMRDSLYDSRVNPIATFPRNGVVAFGQKTLQKQASALDRINVRRLLINLKNFIGDTSKNLVFEQNTSNTRNRFLNVVNPFLESVQQRQGLFAFRVVMDESNNTPDVIDRNQLIGQVLLQPTKTAEFIILDFTILPTGATFGE